MAHTIILIPATQNSGTTAIAYGLADALNNKSVRATVLPKLDAEKIENLLGQNKQDILLEEMVEQRLSHENNKDVLFITGVSLDKPYAAELNFAIALAMDAAVIFIAKADDQLNLIEKQLQILAAPYLNRYEFKIIGCVINKLNSQQTQDIEKNEYFVDARIPLIGKIPYRNEVAEHVGSYHAEIFGAAISKYLDVNWLWQFLNKPHESKLTPPVFRHHLLSLARNAQKRIVLPEGSEPRTLQAANICAERNIARCVLIGDKKEILESAAKINLELNPKIEILEPQNTIEQYVAALVEARRSKGLTSEAARNQLEDNVMLGTMMVQLGEADGLVSGAIHTTANTIRPALQIIKTSPGSKLVSSVFFVCLPDQVLVYGDCAINPNPTAEELADIAIQSAASAETFGIPARVAMLSYSTGTSGFGPDVDLIKEATNIAQQKRSDLAIDGPLQYDAAIDNAVAKLKAPNSKVAGKATVFIFPNLNAGNIAYKTVQRSTGAICIGPMLQGLNKPVNDLSRGCLVEDIVFTIALTAVQAIN